MSSIDVNSAQMRAMIDQLEKMGDSDKVGLSKDGDKLGIDKPTGLFRGRKVRKVSKESLRKLLNGMIDQMNQSQPDYQTHKYKKTEKIKAVDALSIMKAYQQMVSQEQNLSFTPSPSLVDLSELNQSSFYGEGYSTAFSDSLSDNGSISSSDSLSREQWEASLNDKLRELRDLASGRSFESAFNEWLDVLDVAALEYIEQFMPWLEEAMAFDPGDENGWPSQLVQARLNPEVKADPAQVLSESGDSLQSELAKVPGHQLEGFLTLEGLGESELAKATPNLSTFSGKTNKNDTIPDGMYSRYTDSSAKTNNQSNVTFKDGNQHYSANRLSLGPNNQYIAHDAAWRMDDDLSNPPDKVELLRQSSYGTLAKMYAEQDVQVSMTLTPPTEQGKFKGYGIANLPQVAALELKESLTVEDSTGEEHTIEKVMVDTYIVPVFDQDGKKSDFPIDITTLKIDGKTHYNIACKTWPDHQPVPASVLAQLSFLKRLYAGEDSSKPVAVHCSAGIGRTGLFVVSDAAIDGVFEGASVKEAVETIRAYRKGAVQTQDQLRVAAVMMEMAEPVRNAMKTVGVKFPETESFYENVTPPGVIKSPDNDGIAPTIRGETSDSQLKPTYVNQSELSLRSRIKPKPRVAKKPDSGAAQSSVIAQPREDTEVDKIIEMIKGEPSYKELSQTLRNALDSLDPLARNDLKQGLSQFQGNYKQMQIKGAVLKYLQ